MPWLLLDLVRGEWRGSVCDKHKQLVPKRERREGGLAVVRPLEKCRAAPLEEQRAWAMLAPLEVAGLLGVVALCEAEEVGPGVPVVAVWVERESWCLSSTC